MTPVKASAWSTPSASNREGVAPSDIELREPLPILRTMVRAFRDDDGRALDTVVHPVHGMWLWDTPGATTLPAILVKAGHERPSTWLARLAAKRLPDIDRGPSSLKDLAASYAHDVFAIEGWIGRLDVDPPDLDDPVYGTCENEDAPDESLRAWLRSDVSFDAERSVIESEEIEMAPELMKNMVLFRAWGISVYMLRDQDTQRLWVAHVKMWDPCSA